MLVGYFEIGSSNTTYLLQIFTVLRDLTLCKPIVVKCQNQLFLNLCQHTSEFPNLCEIYDNFDDLSVFIPANEVEWRYQNICKERIDGQVL